MRVPLIAFLAAVAACLVASTARSDEALDALVRAGTHLRGAHAWRSTTSTANAADPKKSGVSVIERVDPGRTHYWQEHDGIREVEMFGDGRRALIRAGTDANFEESDRSVAVFLARMREASVWPLAENLKGEVLPSAPEVKDLKAAGHEVIGGKPATIYAFYTEMGGVRSEEKFWISDEDSLLLKSVKDRKGKSETATGVSERIDEHSETIFDYDPALKIVLPEPKAPEPKKSDPEVTSPETAVSSALPSAAAILSFPCESFSLIVSRVSAVT